MKMEIWIFKTSNENNMGLFDSFFGKNKNNLVAHTKGTSMEEMEKIQNSLSDKMNADVFNTTFNQACRLVPKGKYAEALKIFEDVKTNTKDVEIMGTCDNQIGVCYFFLGDFEKAISHYSSSIQNKFDKSMADDNIWEACEALIKKDNNKQKWAMYYLELLPDGIYATQAKSFC